MGYSKYSQLVTCCIKRSPTLASKEIILGKRKKVSLGLSPCPTLLQAMEQSQYWVSCISYCYLTLQSIKQCIQDCKRAQQMQLIMLHFLNLKLKPGWQIFLYFFPFPYSNKLGKECGIICLYLVTSYSKFW